MIQMKTIAVVLLMAIAVVGATATVIGTGIVYAPPCMPGGTTGCPPRDPDDAGHGQSIHDSNGDLNSHGHA